MVGDDDCYYYNRSRGKNSVFFEKIAVYTHTSVSQLAITTVIFQTDFIEGPGTPCRKVELNMTGFERELSTE